MTLWIETCSSIARSSLNLSRIFSNHSYKFMWPRWFSVWSSYFSFSSTGLFIQDFFWCDRYEFNKRFMHLGEEFISCLSDSQLISSSIILQIIFYLSLPLVLNPLLWHHWFILIVILYMYHRQRSQCCTQADCIITSDTYYRL